jgi:hypothetical protein
MAGICESARPVPLSISTGGPMKGTGISSTGPSISPKIFPSSVSLQDAPANPSTARTNCPRKGTDQYISV